MHHFCPQLIGKENTCKPSLDKELKSNSIYSKSLNLIIKVAYRVEFFGTAFATDYVLVELKRSLMYYIEYFIFFIIIIDDKYQKKERYLTLKIMST